MSRLIDILGKRFGRWTVISRAPNRYETARWNCQCDCGNVSEVESGRLRGGTTKSCGCWGAEKAAERMRAQAITHGLSRTKAYKAWNPMLGRCLNPSHHAYADYGGRGITVCDRWLMFENFLEDMGQPPTGLTLERRNNDLGYNRDNCCWATRQEQMNNRRITIFVTVDGRTQPLSEWSRELNVSYATLSHRYRRRGSFELKNRRRHESRVG